MGLARTTTLQVDGLLRSSSESRVRSALERRPGVLSVEPNAVAQTATVTYDPASTSIVELTGWVRECGLHCAGQSVPDHVCDPMEEQHDADHEAGDNGAASSAHAAHDGRGEQTKTSQDAMGHGEHGGGHHGGMR